MVADTPARRREGDRGGYRPFAADRLPKHDRCLSASRRRCRNPSYRQPHRERDNTILEAFNVAPHKMLHDTIEEGGIHFPVFFDLPEGAEYRAAALVCQRACELVRDKASAIGAGSPGVFSEARRAAWSPARHIVERWIERRSRCKGGNSASLQLFTNCQRGGSCLLRELLFA
jgi:hypothetical protein